MLIMKRILARIHFWILVVWVFFVFLFLQREMSRGTKGMRQLGKGGCQGKGDQATEQ